MSPPPSTPKPWRFLVSHRATQSSQTPVASSQFQSTPRFSSSSALKPVDKRKGQNTEDIEEDEDDDVGEDKSRGNEVLGSSPEDEDGQMIDSESASRDDSIEAEPCSPAASFPEVKQDPETPSQLPGGTWDAPIHRSSPRSPRGTQFLVGRDAKRRKLAKVPSLSSSSQQEQEIFEGDSLSDTEEHGSLFNDSQQLPDHTTETSLHQPVFHHPPRFKPLDADVDAEGLPPAFSPQRRGARYVSRGMAAELQGWLSDVKGWEGAERSSPESGLRIIVKEVRPGRRMYLVQGVADDGNQSQAFILAGEGRLTGLGQRADVDVGSVVMLGQPVWEVLLEGQLWTVSCDWSVE
ncbi:hypothetical protein S7711_06283 [Stachybotrys chartarum IBT 7711]|uniref:Uncharacterized protein n=1 Tax=Stachybotrys chartarum (strain CBS 109288 / IBT 7711) TaxID=1280523 RepID=A0A084B830_STACB|nr:hypothetical protein S7711_06283 [Stachybotrys chartarum IBT 7711]